MNIIVSDNNIAKIRCFIAFTSYISFYLIRFRRFKQKNRRLQDMVLPMPESALCFIFCGQRKAANAACSVLAYSVFRKLPEHHAHQNLWRGQRGAMEPGGMAAVRRWQLAGPEGPVALRWPACAGFAHKFYIKQAADCSFPVNRRFL